MHRQLGLMADQSIIKVLVKLKKKEHHLKIHSNSWIKNTIKLIYSKKNNKLMSN